MRFDYQFRDRYNWDWDENDVNKQKSVTIMGFTVTDQHMQEFHKRGLAKEFDMVGSVEEEFSWTHGALAGKEVKVPIPPAKGR